MGLEVTAASKKRSNQNAFITISFFRKVVSCTAIFSPFRISAGNVQALCHPPNPDRSRCRQVRHSNHHRLFLHRELAWTGKRSEKAVLLYCTAQSCPVLGPAESSAGNEQAGGLLELWGHCSLASAGERIHSDLHQIICLHKSEWIRVDRTDLRKWIGYMLPVLHLSWAQTPTLLCFVMLPAPPCKIRRNFWWPSFGCLPPF